MNFNDMINKVIQGDCLEVMKDIPDNSIDLVITDPPYGISFQSAWRTEEDRFDILENDKSVSTEFVPMLFKKLKEGGGLYLFTRWDVYPTWLQSIKESGFMVKNCIVWDRVVHGLGDLKGSYAPQHDFIIFATKGRHILKGKRPKDIIRAMRTDPMRAVHPTQKPIELIDNLILNSSDENDVILDCFLGSGTTALSAIRNRRKFIGIDISEKYCQIARERINKVPKRLDKFVRS